MLSFPPSPQVKIFVCRESVDMRKSFDGLAGTVIDIVDHDPQSGHLFLFFNRKRSMMKTLLSEESGYRVLANRLEHGRFRIFDQVSDAPQRFVLSSTELALLLDGIDLRQLKRQRARKEVSELLDA